MKESNMSNILKRTEIGRSLVNTYAEALGVSEPTTHEDCELAAAGAMSALMHYATSVTHGDPLKVEQLAKESWIDQDPETAERLGLIEWVN